MISLVIPTIRDIKAFLSAWKLQIEKWQCNVIVVDDTNDEPVCILNNKSKVGISEIMGNEYAHLIYNKTDGVRNLGFMLAKNIGSDVIISLDDDVKPVGDSIGDHLAALGKRFPITWMNSSMDDYMRGFPYGIRDDAECVLSHGVWHGVSDLDAKTQLSVGIREQHFYKGPIPYGVKFPMSMMNVAFKIKLLPFIYQAPMFGDIQRFADIWGGIEAKKDIDAHNWSMVSGYSTVFHERASDANINLIKEAKGMEMNENYGADWEYMKLFINKRNQWKNLCKS